MSISMQTGGCRGEDSLETSPRHPACNKWVKRTHKSRVREPRDTWSRNKRDLSRDPVCSSAMCCARRTGGLKTGPWLMHRNALGDILGNSQGRARHIWSAGIETPKAELLGVIAPGHPDESKQPHDLGSHQALQCTRPVTWNTA